MGWNLLKRLGLTALTLAQNVYLLDDSMTVTKMPVARWVSCGCVFFCKKLELKTKLYTLVLSTVIYYFNKVKS